MTERNWYSATSHGYRVGMLLTPAAARLLAERGRPWMRVDRCADAPAPGTPLVVTGPADAARLMTEKYSEQEGDGALREVLLNSAHRAVWVGEQDSPAWHVLQTLRTARNLLRWQALEEGRPCLHGALVEIGGAGIVLAGGKRSGKTSTTLAALGVLGCGFVSNDDVTLVEDAAGSGRWTGVGWPRSVNVRTDALAELARSVPALARLREQSTHPRMEYTKPESASFTVYPEDICRTLAVESRPSAPVKALVLPRFASDVRPALTRLGSDEAAERLYENVDRVATDHDGYLREWFTELDDAAARRHARDLARDIPCYELVQNLATAPESARLLAELSGTLRREHP
ncbi:MAG: hypothetical protein HOY76_30300 [Streptomyces sp.]|nr:hypothetical protein [Streptomyces sp.]